MFRNLAVFFIGFALGLAPTAGANPQAYPDKPVRVVVPLSTGSSSDALARYTALRLSEAWKQQVVVENAPGANGMTGAAIVAKALGTDEARQRALGLGLEVALKAPEEFEPFVVRDKDHWAELVRRSGARVD